GRSTPPAGSLCYGDGQLQGIAIRGGERPPHRSGYAANLGARGRVRGGFGAVRGGDARRALVDHDRLYHGRRLQSVLQGENPSGLRTGRQVGGAVIVLDAGKLPR